MSSNYRYIHGSAAPKLPPQPQREEQQIRKNPPLRKVVVQPEPVKYPMGKMVLCILVGFVILSTLIFRYATITEMNVELAALSAELEQLKDNNRKLQAEIGATINQENIRRIAEERLDMKMPDSYQRIPVKVPNVNYSMVTQTVTENEEKTFISFIAALFK